MAKGMMRREEVTYACPACGAGVLLITAATDGTMRGVYCRKCKTRQAVTLIGTTPAPAALPPRAVPAGVTSQWVTGTPPIETVSIRDRRR